MTKTVVFSPIMTWHWQRRQQRHSDDDILTLLLYLGVTHEIVARHLRQHLRIKSHIWQYWISASPKKQRVFWIILNVIFVTHQFKLILIWLNHQFDALHFLFRLQFKLLPCSLLLHCKVALEISLIKTLKQYPHQKTFEGKDAMGWCGTFPYILSII